ncbi:MAG: lysozyme, partial [Bacteroidales bacterium]
MKISEKGLELIRTFEGCRLTAYQCSAGRWTIGYGHTGKD